VIGKFKFKFSLENLIFNALNNTKPSVSFRTMCIGGKKYKIPIFLNEMKGIDWAIR
jgi:ribosomal protein S7